MNGGAGQERTQAARCIIWAGTPGTPGAAGAPPQADSLPPQLASALERPGFRLVRCHDEFEAMAQACAPLLADPHETTILLLVEPTRLSGAPDIAALIPRYAPRVVMWSYEAAATPQLRAVIEANIRDWRPSKKPVPRPNHQTEPPPGTGSGQVPSVFPDDGAPGIRFRPGPPLSPAHSQSTHPPDKPRAPVRLRLSGDGPLPAPPAPTEPFLQGSAGREVKATRPQAAPPPTPAPAAPTGGASTLLTDEELAMLLASDKDRGHY